MHKKFNTLTVVFSLLVVLQSAHADDDESQRTIRVSGQGKASVVPDMATIQTGVVTQAPTAVEAMSQNNSAVEKIMADLKTMEIDEKDIQTSQFSVQPVYQSGERGNRDPKLVGYRVGNQLRVRVRELPEIGKLLDTLIRSGSNQMSGISFGVDDTTTVMDEARKKAIADARKRAELYADEAGVALGKVLSIDERQIAVPQPRVFGRAMEMSASRVPVAKGELDFTATINVTFELNDK